MEKWQIWLYTIYTFCSTLAMVNTQKNKEQGKRSRHKWNLWYTLLRSKFPKVKRLEQSNEWKK